MDAIREAVEQQMKRKEHSQLAVATLTGVSQSDVSRLLSGQRKRVTPQVIALCEYAEFDADLTTHSAAAERRLSQALRGAIGDNPEARSALTRVLEVLAPLLRNYHSEGPTPSSGADHDDARAH